MKLIVGRNHSQIGVGIFYTRFNGMYQSIVLDLIFFYVELIIKDYPEDWASSGGI